MHDTSRRRIATVARHLLPDDAVSSQSGKEVRSDSVPAFQTQDTAAAQSSYAKVHGTVSRKDATWTKIFAVQRHNLSEVIYEKSLDEGIAKVSRCCLPDLPSSCLACMADQLTTFLAFTRHTVTC